jgi:hypothetical protein
MPEPDYAAMARDMLSFQDQWQPVDAALQAGKFSPRGANMFRPSGMNITPLAPSPGPLHRLMHQWLPETYPATSNTEIEARINAQQQPQQFIGQDVATAHMPMLESIGNAVRINPQAWERFLRESPRSTHVEDRRQNDPTMFGLERAIRIPQERLVNTILR